QRQKPLWQRHDHERRYRPQYLDEFRAHAFFFGGAKLTGAHLLNEVHYFPARLQLLEDSSAVLFGEGGYAIDELLADVLKVRLALQPCQLVPMFEDKSFHRDHTVLEVLIGEVEVLAEGTQESEFCVFHLPVGPKGKHGDLQEKLFKYPGIFSREVHLLHKDSLIENPLCLFSFVCRKVGTRKEQIEQSFLFKGYFLIRMGRCSDDFHDRKPELVALIAKEVRHDAVCIGVDPLTENVYVEEKQAVVKKVGPEISFQVARQLNALFQDLFRQLHRRLTTSKQGGRGSRHLRENVVVEVADVFNGFHDNVRKLIRAVDRCIVEDEGTAYETLCQENFHLVLLVPVFHAGELDVADRLSIHETGGLYYPVERMLRMRASRPGKIFQKILSEFEIILKPAFSLRFHQRFLSSATDSIYSRYSRPSCRTSFFLPSVRFYLPGSSFVRSLQRFLVFGKFSGNLTVACAN